MKIGVFDSGIGGEAVARDLRQHFPDATIITVSDRVNLPYGSKTAAEVIRLVQNAIQPLVTGKCDVIVIACNTATTIALPTLRKQYPSQLFIGIEPMVKTAANTTSTHTIAVCATPATLASERYRGLKAQFASNCTILEPDCADWASMIENNAVNEQTIRGTIDALTAQYADVIVLGCTHYHWIKQLIETTAGNKATILEPTESITRRVKQLIS